MLYRITDIPSAENEAQQHTWKQDASWRYQTVANGRTATCTVLTRAYLFTAPVQQHVQALQHQLHPVVDQNTTDMYAHMIFAFWMFVPAAACKAYCTLRDRFCGLHVCRCLKQGRK